MKKNLYYFIVLIFSVFVLAGCSVPWTKQTPPEEYVEAIDKGAIFENYIESQIQNTDITQEDLEKILTFFDENGIFDDVTGPKSLSGRPLEEKMQKTGDFAQKMMKESGRMRLSENNSTLTDEEIPIVDIATGAKKYFHGNDGVERYEKYLAQRFNIGIYPTPEELVGTWEGRVVLTNVALLKELGGAPVYDPKDFKAINGREAVFNFTITMEKDGIDEISNVVISKKDKEEQNLNENSGTIMPLSTKDKNTLPFFYDFIPEYETSIDVISFTYSDIKGNGKMLGNFSGKNLQGFVDANLTKDDNDTAILEGELHMNMYKGYLKTSALFTATKK